MASSLRLCETFLKRSWQRAATVFAALIALNGVPVEDAQARALAPARAPPPGPGAAGPAATRREGRPPARAGRGDAAPGPAHESPERAPAGDVGPGGGA